MMDSAHRRWLLEVARTPEEQETYKKKMLDSYNDYLTRCQPEAAHLQAEELTCSTCSDANICKLAFDPYNTDGDCLLGK